MTDELRALTIHQPWASLIVGGVKDVENRSWPTTHRGPMLIHAGLSIDPSPWIDCLDDMPLGCVIGVVDVVDCVRDSSSEWASIGSWHWILEQSRACEPRPMRGKLGLWRIDAAESPRIALQRPHSPLAAGRLAL